MNKLIFAITGNKLNRKNMQTVKQKYDSIFLIQKINVRIKSFSRLNDD